MWKGGGVLLLGWVALFHGGHPWIANILISFTWVLYLNKQWDYAAICSVVAIAISMSTFAVEELPLASPSGNLPILEWGYGLWVWLASQLTLLTACLMAMFLIPESTKSAGDN